MPSPQFDAGYLRAAHVIANRPKSEYLEIWVAHPQNRPLNSDTDEFQAGYAKGCREAFERAQLVHITRSQFIAAMGREPEKDDLDRFVSGNFFATGQW